MYAFILAPSVFLCVLCVYLHVCMYSRSLNKIVSFNVESFIDCIYHIHVLEEIYRTILHFSIIEFSKLFQGFFPRWNLKKLLHTELPPDSSFFGVTRVWMESLPRLHSLAQCSLHCSGRGSVGLTLRLRTGSRWKLPQVQQRTVSATAQGDSLFLTCGPSENHWYWWGA